MTRNLYDTMVYTCTEVVENLVCLCLCRKEQGGDCCCRFFSGWPISQLHLVRQHLNLQVVAKKPPKQSARKNPTHVSTSSCSQIEIFFVGVSSLMTIVVVAVM
jgi:hypothetical protein